MDKNASRLKNILFWSSLVGIILIYLILRLGWKDTIEFGYDQPLLSLRVLDFLRNPTFINSFNFVRQNPWGYPSWGPMQIFFYSLFLLISKNPQIASLLIALFNVLSIMAIFIVGKKFISPLVGLISALVLATHPWWVVFSRMIYQPTPVVTFICISMFLSLLFYKKRNGWIIIPLFLLWGILFQLYIHTASFIAASLFLFIRSIKKVNYHHLTLGLFSLILLFLPVINHYFKAPGELFGYINISNKFVTLKSENSFSNLDIVKEFFHVVSGGGFEWQLGYAYKEFIDSFSLFTTINRVNLLLVIGILAYHFFELFVQKEDRILRITLLLWLIGPILFLVIIKSPIALPRYFLQSLPAFAILFAIFIEEVAKKIKANSISGFVKILPVLIGPYWIVFMVNYYDFVRNYHYPYGFLSNYSDIPYSFLEKSLEWIVNDAKVKGFSNITISQNPKNPLVYNPNWATRYSWENVFRKKLVFNSNAEIGHYLLYLTPARENLTGRIFVQYGPYLVYRY